MEHELVEYLDATDIEEAVLEFELEAFDIDDEVGFHEPITIENIEQISQVAY